MKLCVALLIAVLVRGAPAGQPACREVDGERILARDLAAAIPGFNALPPQLPVAIAPLPGSRRIMRVSELVSLARRNSIDLPAVGDLCFEWPMGPLEQAAVMQAMRAALKPEADAPEATIE